MTKCNRRNVKSYNSEFNKLKSAIKNGTEVTLNLSSNLIGNSNDEITFLHKLLLTDPHISKIRTAFANISSANIKFSKIPLSKIVQFLFPTPNIFEEIISSPANLVMNSFVKELKNKDLKK